MNSQEIGRRLRLRSTRSIIALTIPLTLLVSVLALSSRADAQPGEMFGKNKVQYKDLDWKFIQSPHFDVYFYEGGLNLAEFCAEQAEKALVSIEHTVKYDITNRVAILVYDSHNDFQQTNAVGEFLPEGVGGVTELFKNRVVVPYEGSPELFRHVIHHELVHAVINDMFAGGSYQSLLTGGGMEIPSWMNEGLAEYESLKGLDLETDQFMRDATLNNAVPSLDRLGGYIQYRVGQTMYWYISQKYGPDKVGELLQRIKLSRSVESGFHSTFGLSVGEFGEKFIDALKVLYYPDIARFEDPTNFAEVMADHKKLGNFLNSSPEISPQGDLVAFISDRNDYYDLYVQSIAHPKDIKRVLKGGGATSNFEELHLLAPGLTWSPDGKHLALAAKASERDAIYIIDVNSETNEVLPNMGLDAIAQLKWSPDGKTLAIIGVKTGASDLYLYDFASKELTNLTQDIFEDRDPEWTPDGKSIYFASARDSNVIPGLYPVSRALELTGRNYTRDIYRYDLATKTVKRITNTPNADEYMPVIPDKDSTLFFISNQNGINNVWSSRLDGSEPRPLTNSLSKIDQFSVSNDASKLVFSATHKGAYDMFLVRNPLDRRFDSLPVTEYRKNLSGVLVSRMDTLAGMKHSKSDVDTAAKYGGVTVDLHDYVFGNNTGTERSEHDFRPNQPSLATITDFKDSSGHYKVHQYRTVFTPDVILGTAGYTGYYGLQGSTQMLFSDELGNQQIYFGTNLILDLKNSDYVLAYNNLEDRMNWGLTGFHTAQFLLVDQEPLFPGSIVEARFTSFGLTGVASYPLNRFSRWDYSASAYVLEKDLIVSQDVPTKRQYTVVPSVSYVHDDALWSYFYPRSGLRYHITLAATPRIATNWLGFITPSLDIRDYIKITGDISLATRFAAAGSYGPNPQKFFIGGVDNWINRFFSATPFTLTDPSDYAFFTAGRPLRGYAYNERIGTQYAITNLELRYPFPIIVGGFPLAFFGDSFIDAGTAWNNKLYLFQKQQDGSWKTRDLLLSCGTGIRTYLFGFYVHMDIAWTTNLQDWSHANYLFSLGEDF